MRSHTATIEPDLRTVYGILIQCKDGSEFLAFGPQAVCATFYKFRSAVKYKRELRTHGITGRVIKLDITVRQHDPAVRDLSA